MEISTVSASQSMDDSNSAAFYVSIIIGLLGLIGNAFVCLVMLRYRSIFNSPTNKLIIHQSVVDFLGSFMFLLSLFLKVSPPSQVPDNIFGSLYCKLWMSAWPQYSLYTVSCYNVVAISIERFYATCQPVRHRNKFSSHRLKMIIAVIWICSLVPMLHLILISYKTQDGCDVSWPSRTVQVVVGLFIVYSITLFIPLFIIIFSYIKIILELLKRSRARVGDNNQDARNMLTRANKNTTLTLFVVAIFMVICWTPGSTNYALYNLGLSDIYDDSTLHAIVVLNLCINPFIYCFTYERFQKQVKKMVCGGRQHNVNRVDVISARQEANAQRTVQVSVVVSANLPDSPAES